MIEGSVQVNTKQRGYIMPEKYDHMAIMYYQLGVCRNRAYR